MIKERKKRSVVWKLSTVEFKNLIKNSSSLSEALRKLGIKPYGGNSKTLKNRIKLESINISHISIGRGSNKGKSFIREKIPLKDILVSGSTYNRGHLKRRLMKEGLLINECYVCLLEPIWREEELVLILDHINGVSDDNRITNLRLLCPNCNSQTETFAGRNVKC